jgi:high-affinity nickel permease
MSVLDTLDRSFLNFAYGWAFSKPVRKVCYNMTITGLSVAVALLIGSIELFGLLADELHLSGAFWSLMASFDINRAGFIIVGLSVVTVDRGARHLALRADRAALGDRGGVAASAAPPDAHGAQPSSSVRPAP